MPSLLKKLVVAAILFVCYNGNIPVPLSVSGYTAYHPVLGPVKIPGPRPHGYAAAGLFRPYVYSPNAYPYGYVHHGGAEIHDAIDADDEDSSAATVDDALDLDAEDVDAIAEIDSALEADADATVDDATGNTSNDVSTLATPATPSGKPGRRFGHNKITSQQATEWHNKIIQHLEEKKALFESENDTENAKKMADKITDVNKRMKKMLDRANANNNNNATPTQTEAEIDSALEVGDDEEVSGAELNFFGGIGDAISNAVNRAKIEKKQEHKATPTPAVPRRNPRIFDAEIDDAVDLDEAIAKFNQDQVSNTIRDGAANSKIVRPSTRGGNSSGGGSVNSRNDKKIKRSNDATPQQSEFSLDEVSFDGENEAEIDDAIDLDEANTEDQSNTNTPPKRNKAGRAKKAGKKKNTGGNRSTSTRGHNSQSQQQPQDHTTNSQTPQNQPEDHSSQTPQQPDQQSLAELDEAIAQSNQALNQVLPPHVHVHVDVNVNEPKPTHKRNKGALRKIAKLIEQQKQ